MEVVWDKSDVVHMDDAMAVPATGGFYKSVAHHFYEVHHTCMYAAVLAAQMEATMPSRGFSRALGQLFCRVSTATFVLAGSWIKLSNT